MSNESAAIKFSLKLDLKHPPGWLLLPSIQLIRHMVINFMHTALSTFTLNGKVEAYIIVEYYTATGMKFL